MYSHECYKRVRYAETDKMGFLYYGHYAKLYEIGRVESLRSLGLSYRAMEDELGLLLPVLSLEARYLLPAYYDDNIKIITQLKELPLKMFTFYHELINPEGKVINKATVKLFCVEKDTNKRVTPPQQLIERLNPYFSGEKSSQ